MGRERPGDETETDRKTTRSAVYIILLKVLTAKCTYTDASCWLPRNILDKGFCGLIIKQFLPLIGFKVDFQIAICFWFIGFLINGIYLYYV